MLVRLNGFVTLGEAVLLPLQMMACLWSSRETAHREEDKWEKQDTQLLHIHACAHVSVCVMCVLTCRANKSLFFVVVLAFQFVFIDIHNAGDCFLLKLTDQHHLVEERWTDALPLWRSRSSLWKTKRKEKIKYISLERYGITGVFWDCSTENSRDH